MRAEQWMMVGVGAIGLYAAYRLVTNTPRKVQIESRGTPTAQLTHPAWSDRLPTVSGAYYPWWSY